MINISWDEVTTADIIKLLEKGERFMLTQSNLESTDARYAALMRQMEEDKEVGSIFFSIVGNK